MQHEQLQISAETRAELDAAERAVVELRQRAHLEHLQTLSEQPILERLVFTATHRCKCGAGLAYDPVNPWSHERWCCSEQLLGTEVKGALHTLPIPFAFWDVMSEQSPQARGRTTRTVMQGRTPEQRAAG